MKGDPWSCLGCKRKIGQFLPQLRSKQWAYRKDLQGKSWKPLPVECLQGPKFLLDITLTFLPEAGVEVLPIFASGIPEAPELSVCPGPRSWQWLTLKVVSPHIRSPLEIACFLLGWAVSEHGLEKSGSSMFLRCLHLLTTLCFVLPPK